MAYRGMEIRQGDGMDNYLNNLGLFKKPMPPDETCLFRAASEQIYATQKYHDQLKERALAYIDRHPEKFEDMNDVQASIQALAVLYRHDFVIYQEISKPPVNLTNFGYPKKVILCESFGNHFDCVYPRSFQMKAAVCQSLVYEMLYKGIFRMDTEVSAAVGLVRRQNFRAGTHFSANPGPMNSAQRYSQGCPEVERQLYPYPNFTDTKPNAPGGIPQSQNASASTSFPVLNPIMHPVSYYLGAPATMMPRTPTIVEVEEDEEIRNKELEMAINGPPFPYRVAKALDPVVYRNIEYDVWLDDKKAHVRSTHRVFEASPFPPGTNCLVRLDTVDDAPYLGIVQELSPSGETAIVFLPQLGERQQVHIDRLEGGPRNPMNAREDSCQSSRTRRTTWTPSSQYEIRSRSHTSYSWPPMAPMMAPVPVSAGLVPPPIVPNAVDTNIRWRPISAPFMQTPSNVGMQMPLRPVDHPPTEEDITTLSQFYRLGGCEYFRQLMAASQQNPRPIISQHYPAPIVVSPEQYPPHSGPPMAAMSFQPPPVNHQPMVPPQ